MDAAPFADHVYVILINSELQLIVGKHIFMHDIVDIAGVSSIGLS